MKIRIVYGFHFRVKKKSLSFMIFDVRASTQGSLNNKIRSSHENTEN